MFFEFFCFPYGISFISYLKPLIITFFSITFMQFSRTSIKKQTFGCIYREKFIETQTETFIISPRIYTMSYMPESMKCLFHFTFIHIKNNHIKLIAHRFESFLSHFGIVTESARARCLKHHKCIRTFIQSHYIICKIKFIRQANTFNTVSYPYFKSFITVWGWDYNLCPQRKQQSF